MLTIKLELDNEEISKLLGEREIDGVLFTAKQQDDCIGYGIFKVEEEVVYICECSYSDETVLDGIVRAAINWASTLGAEFYDITKADPDTKECLRSAGYTDKGSWESIINSCNH